MNELILVIKNLIVIFVLGGTSFLNNFSVGQD